MSYRITSDADRRIRAAYASEVPTLPAPTTASREIRLMGSIIPDATGRAYVDRSGRRPGAWLYTQDPQIDDEEPR
ncbi:hypothetical protein GCM10022204_23680 [Microlunatus aurantiacus]|uniref:Uncharacterized protein n=1 Tax=Microlunatus aurantiacus TaxID=446786 RepID=A0ABP7DGJ4_9ACTN